MYTDIPHLIAQMQQTSEDPNGFLYNCCQVVVRTQQKSQINALLIIPYMTTKIWTGNLMYKYFQIFFLFWT